MTAHPGIGDLIRSTFSNNVYIVVDLVFGLNVVFGLNIKTFERVTIHPAIILILSRADA